MTDQDRIDRVEFNAAKLQAKYPKLFTETGQIKAVVEKQVKEQIVDWCLEGLPIKRVGEFNGMYGPSKWVCTAEGCGKERLATPNVILYVGSGCPFCEGVTQ